MKTYGKVGVALALLLSVSVCGVFAENGIEVTADVVYGHKDGMALTYDVIRPSEDANGAAVLFMVSGGWVSRWYPPEQAGEQFKHLIEKGYTLYMVRHGSAPKFKVPDAVKDVKKAFDHIYENAAEHGVDAKRLGVFGGSAGGHLSLMLGCATGPVGEEPSSDAKKGIGRAAAVVAYFPPVDLREVIGPNDRFPALDFAAERGAYVSPILHVTPDDTPTLLVHGDKDDLVPILSSEMMYAAMQDHGVETKYVVIEGGGHGFQGEGAAQAQEELVAWFDKHLAD